MKKKSCQKYKSTIKIQYIISKVSSKNENAFQTAEHPKNTISNFMETVWNTRIFSSRTFIHLHPK
jgi:hypothetical protein